MSRERVGIGTRVQLEHRCLPNVVGDRRAVLVHRFPVILDADVDAFQCRCIEERQEIVDIGREWIRPIDRPEMHELDGFHSRQTSQDRFVRAGLPGYLHD